MTKRVKSQEKAIGKRKKLFWIIGLVLLAVAAVITYRLTAGSSSDTVKEMPVADIQKKAIDPSVLTGRWLRPDGGYVLQLWDIGPSGQMRAQYFNPQSINVSSSRWKEKDDRLGIFVELRDVNYPGSTYTLSYDSTSDRMRGIYYQAAMQQQFEVEFVRLK